MEIALLDLIGKKYGMPLYQLLGGRCRGCVEVCWVAYLRGDIPLEDEIVAFDREIREKLSEGL